MSNVVHLQLVDITGDHRNAKAVVKWRLYRDDRWSRCGFWMFPLPTHISHFFHRAYAQLDADQVYYQPTLDNYPDGNIVYS